MSHLGIPSSYALGFRKDVLHLLILVNQGIGTGDSPNDAGRYKAASTHKGCMYGMNTHTHTHPHIHTHTDGKWQFIFPK